MTDNLHITTNSSFSPSDWVETTLGEVCEIVGGGTPKTTVNEYWNGKIPWLSVVDFNDDNRWVSKTEKTITEKGVKESSTKILNTGDLIISARGTVGALAQLKIPMAFNQSCYGIKEKENISDKHFLFYLIKQSLSQIGRNVHGAVFDTITRETFNHIQISLPPLPEQKAIASALSAFDDKIEILREENKTLEEMAQTIYKEWFGKYSIEKTEELPEGCRVGKLGEENFAEIIGSGINKFDGEKVYLATADVSDSNITNTNEKITFQKRPSRANMQPIEKSIWFAKMKDSRKILMFDDYSEFEIENFILSTGFAGINTTELSHYFIWCFILSKEFDELKNNMANGAVQIAVNNTNLRRIEILIPDNETLAKFNEIAKPIFKKIYDNSKQIQFLSHSRDELLPKLMSGQVKVNL